MNNAPWMRRSARIGFLFCQNINQELWSKHISFSNHVTFALLSRNSQRTSTSLSSSPRRGIPGSALKALPLSLAWYPLASFSVPQWTLTGLSWHDLKATKQNSLYVVQAPRSKITAKVLLRAALLPSSPPKEASKTGLEVLVCLYRWRKVKIAAGQLNRFPQETCPGEVHIGVGHSMKALGKSPAIGSSFLWSHRQHLSSQRRTPIN